MPENYGFEGEVKTKIPRWFNKPRQVTVNILRDEWNNNEQIIKLKKYIGEFHIKRSDYHPSGSLEWPTNIVTITDSIYAPPNVYKAILGHEVIGHVFWYNNIINTPKQSECETYLFELPPLTTFVSLHEPRFKLFRTTYNYNMYADEQHSALADIILSGGSPGWETLVEGKEKEECTEFFKKLHNM